MDVTFRMLALLFQNNSHMHKKFFSTQSKSFWYGREGVTRKDYVEKKDSHEDISSYGNSFPAFNNAWNSG